MKLPSDFVEYLKRGIVKKISPDKPRAAFLMNESQNSLEVLMERIEKLGISDKNANSLIKESYDIIMGVIRAKMLLEGFSASGSFAHETEVSYLNEMHFSDNEIILVNELRFFRNSVNYYGKILDKIYAQKVTDLLYAIYPKLKSNFK